MVIDELRIAKSNMLLAQKALQKAGSVLTDEAADLISEIETQIADEVN